MHVSNGANLIIIDLEDSVSPLEKVTQYLVTAWFFVGSSRMSSIPSGSSALTAIGCWYA